MARRVPRAPHAAPRTWQARCSLPCVNDPRRTPDSPAHGHTEFYDERKWCEHCRTYVRFLMSVNHSFCVDCGGRVRLFNRTDSRSFHDTVQRHKWQAS